MSAERSGWADDYVTVAERIAAFKRAYPEGRLQPVDLTRAFDVIEIGGDTFVVYVAACYRTPDDPRPGIGVAWQHYPGDTRFTRFTELMNCETSAWGRAIVAALVADARTIASADEVAAVRDGDASAAPRPRRRSKLDTRREGLLARARALDDPVLELLVQRRADLDLPRIEQSSARQCAQWDELLSQLEQIEHSNTDRRDERDATEGSRGVRAEAVAPSLLDESADPDQISDEGEPLCDQDTTPETSTSGRGSDGR